MFRGSRLLQLVCVSVALAVSAASCVMTSSAVAMFVTRIRRGTSVAVGNLFLTGRAPEINYVASTTLSHVCRPLHLFLRYSPCVDILSM